MTTNQVDLNQEKRAVAKKAAIVNVLGLAIEALLLISYCWLPRDSLAFGPLNRLWRGIMASIAFDVLAIDFILVIDWVTLKEWFEFNADIAKAVILCTCIAGMVAIFIFG